jgi:hypothetical protein
MIEASQRMIRVNSQGELGGSNPVIKRHFELQIRTLQNAPRRDVCREVGTAFESKRKREKEQEAMHTLKTHRKVSYRRD